MTDGCACDSELFGDGYVEKSVTSVRRGQNGVEVDVDWFHQNVNHVSGTVDC